MKITARLATLAFISLLAGGQVFASDVDELTAMLHEFLAAADEEHAHERFWAEDLVYSSSAGEPPAIIYTGEEVDVRVYGDTAVVAFKLVGTPTDESDEGSILNYFNTGTFVKHDGVWKVVAWQATKIPESNE